MQSILQNGRSKVTTVKEKALERENKDLLKLLAYVLTSPNIEMDGTGIIEITDEELQAMTRSVATDHDIYRMMHLIKVM